MDIIKNVLNGIVETVFGVTFIQIMSAELKSEEYNDAATQAMSTINEVVVPIASVMVAIYFTLALIDKVSSDNFNTDQFIKLLIKLVVSIGIIDNADALSGHIMKFGTLFTGAITEHVTDKALELIKFEDLNVIQGFVLLLVMILPFIASLLVMIVGYFMIFAYKLEFSIRCALAPIGFADFVTNGTNSNGMRYLKSLIGMSMQGGIMILVLGASAILTEGIVDSVVSQLDGFTVNAIITTLFWPLAIPRLIGVQAATVGLLSTARTISRELV